MLLGGGTGGGGVIKTENTSKDDGFKKGFVDGAGEGVKEIVESLNPAEIFKNLKDAAGEFIKNPVKAIFGFVKAVVTSIAHINELKDAWDAYQDEDWERLGRITGKLVVDVGGQLAGMLLGGSTVVNTIRQAARKFTTDKKTARSEADKARDEGRENGAAAQLDVDGYSFVDVSGSDTPLHPSVSEALEGVPLESRKPWHGGCAEPRCISQALTAGINPRGGTMIAVQIGNRGKVPHGEARPPCPSCVALRDVFGYEQ